MFQTTTAGHVPVPPGLSDEGAQLWTFIRQSLALPWFHLSLERTEREYEEPYKLVDTVFATRREQWLQLEQVDPDTRVLGIQLVSPPWLNKTATWRMEPLREIWSMPEQNSLNGEATMYVVEGDRRYVHSEDPGDFDESLAQLVFRSALSD